jgi:Uri superfamily endonuclease
MAMTTKHMKNQPGGGGITGREPFRGKGTYVLLITVSREQQIKVGCLGLRQFYHGSYAYIGSAMNGFGARLSHHLGEKKRPHWHIDYLLQRASLRDILLIESEERAECAVARALVGRLNHVPGFGSSDCRCRSHLFFAADGEQLETVVRSALSHLGYRPFLFPLQDTKTI